jgi:hypothetical protein
LEGNKSEEIASFNKRKKHDGQQLMKLTINIIITLFLTSCLAFGQKSLTKYEIRIDNNKGVFHDDDLSLAAHHWWQLVKTELDSLD